MKDCCPAIINDFERLDNVIRHLTEYQRELGHDYRDSLLAASAYQLFVQRI
jgi:hypothetical protein